MTDCYDRDELAELADRVDEWLAAIAVDGVAPTAVTVAMVAAANSNAIGFIYGSSPA